ncbi:protein Tob1 [Lucilia cuprina]|uniref:protein Tob1 n=1 Tax=Lucilia cuprina TaxID=7375 RepID=UPI001F059E6E|nr:protein Tob1 [Lucilia cuprina]XP_046802338.1 protein Tob1 [Lucilia cuprina]XP_046802339.1 protein Tob1 [Lucilia cuprina]XP_046802340.1 protein Tob1 [Lucilia cuprina]
MHIEIQVALNFVISYLYNKLPRRRVNIFGEELEKALRDKFQGHWYPEKPFKGSAFRCLKTGDPIDSVLERAARESGVPITDILENLPNELSVWVDPGEVSYRIGEKGSVKILYSENSDNQEDNSSADGEVNKTFNPEAQCFRPIEAVNTSMNNLSLSPKTSPLAGSSPLSASSNSPTYKGSPNPVAAAVLNGGSFLQRSQAPLTFTTATFAQTKFGSTKLKTNSKRTNNTSYRMSPTEFSNYIKQRAMQQQQIHHGHGHSPNGGSGQPGNHFGPIGPVSPARSLSPNPLSLGLTQNGTAANGDPFYFPNMAMGMYPQFNNHHRNLFDTHFHADNNGLYGHGNNGVTGHGKFNNYLEPHGFYGMGGGNHMPPHQQQPQSPIGLNGQQQQQQQHPVGVVGNAAGNMKNSNENISNNSVNAKENAGNNNNAANITVTVTNGSVNGSESNGAVSPVPSTGSATAANQATNTERQSAANAVAAVAAATVAAAASSTANSNNSQDSGNNAAATAASNSKLIDGLNSFYSNTTGSYQQLLVAN